MGRSVVPNGGITVSARGTSIFRTLGLELPGQQRLDLLERLRGRQLREQAAQVRVGFELVGASRLHQAVEVGARLDTTYRIGEQPVAPS